MSLMLVQCGGAVGTAVHRCCYDHGKELKDDEVVSTNKSMSWCQPSVAYISQHLGQSVDETWANCYKDQYAYIRKNGARSVDSADAMPPNGSYRCVPMDDAIRAGAPRAAHASYAAVAASVLACSS